MKHEFAFFLEDSFSITKKLAAGDQIYIENKDMFHRISNILRLEKGENFILFDRKEHIKIKLKDFSKKKIISGTIVKKEKNKILKPHITFLLPLLKKEYFELALYTLVEMGTNAIEIFTTEKSQARWTPKMYLRSLKIVISAAEQSKNFAFPHLHKPKNMSAILEHIINAKNTVNIFFDPKGESLHEVIKKLDIKLYETPNIHLMIGPEADLTEKEKKMLIAHNFIFCKLTPTILRAFQAATLGLGAFRSLLV